MHPLAVRLQVGTLELSKSKKKLEEEGKTVFGETEFLLLSVMFFMDWFMMDLIEVTGLILLIDLLVKSQRILAMIGLILIGIIEIPLK
ncbi:hypothetical protein CEXT_654441 [Caerostris extrusa]|uniref:Uncharacterized protein n=1 Tax=Caerostris extrusa TaxID=172846 RepID=A0AAV4TRT7_CAEEX|nr:hypothetical protein CEXT_654441 [Caerostris extrusa]